MSTNQTPDPLIIGEGPGPHAYWPPKTKKKFPVWGIVCLIIGGVLILACCGIGVVSLATGDWESNDGPVGADDKRTERKVAEPTKSPDPEPEETEEPEPETGTRDNPIPVGENFTVGDWEISMDATRSGPEVTQEILNANMFNDGPKDGNVYAMAGVTVTYLGEGSSDPTWDLNFKFLGSDGVVRNGWDSQCSVVLPNDLNSLDELFTDASASGNVCVSVPEDVAVGGQWIVEPLISFNDRHRVYAATS